MRSYRPLLLAVCWCAAVMPQAYAAEPADTAAGDRLLALDGTIQSINEELGSQRADLGALKAEVRGMNAEDAEFRRSMLNELKALRRQNQSLVDALFAGQTAGQGGVGTVTPLRNYDMQTPDGKMFFGEAEYIYVREANATIDARIDSGAAVSSISATDITEFERSGKKWYRFNLQANGRTLQIEAPFVRYSDIRQSSKSETVRRPVVSLNLKIGDFSTSSEFTLADRTHMQYALLIGRTMLQDVAVVDVARSYIQKRADPEGLILLNRDAYAKLEKEGINPNAAFDEKQKNAAGQIAYPSAQYGANLGTDPDKALPQAVSGQQQEQQK